MNSTQQQGRLPWLKGTLSVLVTALAMAGIVGIQRSQLAQSTRSLNYAQELQHETLRLQLLKQAPTFGFNNLVADWVFINFLVYYGDDEARSQTGYGLSPTYFDVVTRLDPWFVQIYPFLSAAVSYQAGQPEKTIQLIQRGTATLSPKINPKAFIGWRYQGLDQLLLLGDIPHAIYSHKMAAEWVKGTPDAALAPVFQQTADFLSTDPDNIPIRVRSWAEVYIQAANARDRQTQARAEREITKLGGKIHVKDGQVSLTLPSPRPTPPASR